MYAKIGERVGENPGINLLVSLDPDYPNKLLHDRQEECEEQHTDQDTQPFPVAMDQKWKSIPLSNSGIRGTTATLLVRERVRPPEKIDTDVPANVVAARDGQIK